MSATGAFCSLACCAFFALARAIAAATASFLLSLLEAEDVDSPASFSALRSRAWRLRSSRNFAISLLSGRVSDVAPCAEAACFALAAAIAAATAGFTSGFSF